MLNDKNTLHLSTNYCCVDTPFAITRYMRVVNVNCMPKISVFVGQKYSRLTVIERLPNKNGRPVFKCRCDCGNIWIGGSSSLREGNTQSCGCLCRERTGAASRGRNRSKIAVGTVYGKLTVVERLPNRKGSALFRCECSCGNKNYVVLGGALLRRTECGNCGRAPHLSKLRELQRKNPGKASKHAVFLHNVRGAKKRGLKWLLSEEEFGLIGQQNCHYCGCAPSNRMHGKGHYGEHVYNGVDRLNSALGYTATNCVASCWVCNRAKNSMSEHEFMVWVKRVYLHSACSYAATITNEP